MTCNSKNLIYMIFCINCTDTMYLGETGDTLRSRARVHRQQIHDPTIMNLKVSHHIHNCTKHIDVDEKFKILPIYKMPTEDVKKMQINGISLY